MSSWHPKQNSSSRRYYPSKQFIAGFAPTEYLRQVQTLSFICITDGTMIGVNISLPLLCVWAGCSSHFVSSLLLPPSHDTTPSPSSPNEDFLLSGHAHLHWADNRGPSGQIVAGSREYQWAMEKVNRLVKRLLPLQKLYHLEALKPVPPP
jgi:hypothetical protein